MTVHVTSSSSASGPPESVDFAFVAILRDTYDALVQTCRLEQFEQREGYLWAWGVVDCRDSAKLTVVVGYPLDRENLAAATFVDAMLRAWIPGSVMVVDVGGGVQGRDDLALGDVVVHTWLHYYDFHKIGEDGREIPRHVPLPGSSSYLRELSRRPATRRDTSWLADISTPRPEPGIPTVHQGEMLSGGALLSESPRLTDLLERHDKVLTVEMEGAGAGRAVLDSGLRERQPEFLIIRGISDFCNAGQSSNQATRDRWRIYAAQAAAAHAVAVVREVDGSRPHGSARSIATRKRVAPIAIPSLPARITDETWPFEVQIRIDTRLYAVDELPDLALRFRRLALLGRAGAGKTSVAMRALRSCSGQIPVVFVARDGWIRDLADALLDVDPGRLIHDWRAALDVLLRGATSDVTVGQLETLATEGPVLLVVDGINCGAAPVAIRVLDVLDEALRHLQLAAALVTDRAATRYPAGGRWTVANVIELDGEVAGRHIDDRYSVGTWERMPEASRRLLSSPFFLDLALRGAELTSATRSEALGNYIANQAQVERSAVAETVTATAAAYAAGSHRLQLDALSPSTAKALIETGIAAPPALQAEYLTFTHELFGDYFASLHLADGFDDWQPTGLDAISFSGDRWQFEGLSADTESFDTITLAAEQMRPAGVGDPYLRAVYDWNWRAAVDCLAATSPHDGAFSPAARLVVLSLLSERRMDPVDGTRRRATRLLGKLTDDIARRLASTPAASARSIIASQDLAVPWFARWREVFCRDPHEQWSGEALDEICDTDTLHGWTVSYVLKRRTLSRDACHRLKGTYRGLRVGATTSANLQASIRWRIVHSLAAGQSADDILSFLLSALDDDPYPWVRWGAARSITEFAARSKRRELTARAIDELAARAHELPDSVRQEIAWVSQYHGAATHFPALMRPLLQTLQSHASGEVARARWDEWMTRFDVFWGRL